MIRSREPSIEMYEVTDPVELAKGQAQWERANQNWSWFQAHAPEIFVTHRGKCICVAGQELFVADTPQEVLALAKAAHPADDGRFTRYIPRERIYAVAAGGSIP